MEFTREPVVESIITPKEGHKLVVRNSKGVGSEEYFVDALELVSFSNTFFFRSLDRPKAFIVPATDYEVIEVREAKMVLKVPGAERGTKQESQRERGKRQQREDVTVKEETAAPAVAAPAVAAAPAAATTEVKADDRNKKRERRRHYRRNRGRGEDGSLVEGVTGEERTAESAENGPTDAATPPPPKRMPASMLPPPPTLISETLERYREDQLFKDVFFIQEEKIETAESLVPHVEGTTQIAHEEVHEVTQINQEEPPVVTESINSEEEST